MKFKMNVIADSKPVEMKEKSVLEVKIEEFKKKVCSGDFKNLTILGIALECGFNSKSSFNRIFKESAGITPGEYLRHRHE